MAIIPVHAGDNLQVKINSAVAGDILELEAGATWDGSFTLPNVSGASALLPVTIRSANYASLPSGRVAPSDAVNMPRIRTISSTAPFVTALNASWWILDGLEITDNVTDNTVPNLLDLGVTNIGVHDITLQRLYMHQKETGVNYYRAVIRAVQFEGTGLTYKWCYVGPFVGYYFPAEGSGTHTQRETCCLLSVGGDTITLHDNYLNAWWNTMFLGGADTAAQNVSVVSGATTTSATFSNTTGLTAGVMLRLELHGTGTLNASGITAACVNQGGVWPGQGGVDSAATITRTSGVSLTASDIRRIGNMVNTGDASNGLFGLCSVSGNIYTVAQVKTQFPNSGTVDWVLYETAVVTSVVGSTVNYTPTGSDALVSSGATSASWNYGDQGFIYDVNLTQNTFDKDVAFALDVYTQTGNAPKGTYEFKNVKRLLVEGNYFIGFPSLIAHYSSNQYGTAPWIAVTDITIRSNWFDYTIDNSNPKFTACQREAIGMTSQNDYATVSPTYNVEISNNFIRGVDAFITGKSVLGYYRVFHNTVISNASSTYGSHGTIKAIDVFPTYDFHDNIFSLIVYGFNCGVGNGSLPACVPVGTFANNVRVNTAGVSAGDLTLSNYTFNNSTFATTYTAYSSIGFVDMAANNFRLAPSSVYYHLGTGGTDPGINQTTLEAALRFNPTTSTPVVVSGQVVISGPVVIGG